MTAVGPTETHRHHARCLDHDDAATTTTGCQTTAVTTTSSTPTVTTSGAASTLVITGHGWGHGIGMGQWGAYGYALHGWSYTQILRHYYRGTTIAAGPSPTVRVLLARPGAQRDARLGLALARRRRQPRDGRAPGGQARRAGLARARRPHAHLAAHLRAGRGPARGRQARPTAAGCS